MEKNKKDKFQFFINKLKKLAKNAPSDEEILGEFERGDFSSIDPNFFKTGHDMANKFLEESKKQNRSKKLQRKPTKTKEIQV